MERQTYNKAILQLLSKQIEKHPNLRFGQLLVACDIIKYEKDILCNGQRENLLIIDPFYEESEITFKRIIDKLWSIESI